MEATWSLFVGVLIMIIAIFFGIYYYLIYKKIYLVLLIISVSVYVFSVLYAWDIFDPNKNIILLMLIFSTISMALIGKYFSNIKLKSEKHTSLKEKDY